MQSLFAPDLEENLYFFSSQAAEDSIYIFLGAHLIKEDNPRDVGLSVNSPFGYCVNGQLEVSSLFPTLPRLFAK